MMNSRSIAGAGEGSDRPGFAGVPLPGAWFTPEDSLRFAASILAQLLALSELRTGCAARTRGAIRDGICHGSCRIAQSYAAMVMSGSRCGASHSGNRFLTKLRRGSQFVARDGAGPSAALQTFLSRVF